MTSAFLFSFRLRRALQGFFLLAAIVTNAPVFSQETAVPSQALYNLLQLYSRDTGPYFPFSASDNGARRYDSVFANDLSEEWRAGLKGVCVGYLDKLRDIGRTMLSRQEQLSYDIFEHRLNDCIDSFAYPYHLLPVNQMGRGWPASFPVIGSGKGSHPFKTVQNYEDFLKRIDGFVAWMDSAIVNMRTGMAQGITQPRDLMLKVIPQLDAHIVETPRQSMFYEPLTRFPADFDDAAKNALTEKYETAIASKIIPAYRKLRIFIHDEYLPACRTSHGLRDLPGGSAAYRRAVKQATTTDMTPDDIHALGLSEVERINAEIRKLRAEIDSAKVQPLTRYRDVDSLIGGYSELRSLVEKALPRLFGRLPTADYEIRAIEQFRENSMSPSYAAAPLDGSRPGVFYVNAAAVRSGTGSTAVSRSLFLHEAVPGHHMQMALQRENKELPLMRRLAWYGAYGEGWALYSEGLGVELGLYENRRDHLQMLYEELTRSARLVVDVGLHELGWSKQQAVDYLKQNGVPSDVNAIREVERYMAWPGQALSYKIGQLKLLEIRKKAERRLEATFDLRAFHDELLKDGAMPLDILDRKMESWIAAQERKSPSVTAGSAGTKPVL